MTLYAVDSARPSVARFVLVLQAMISKPAIKYPPEGEGVRRAAIRLANK